MNSNVIRIEIEEQEWNRYPRSKRERIEELLSQYGCDIKHIIQTEDPEEE